MNNRSETENFWLQIRNDPSRRAMRSFASWRIIVWFVLLGLIGCCIWQGAQWWHLNTEINNALQTSQPGIDHQLKSLLEDVNVKKQRLFFLEDRALAFQNNDLISWMTAQVEGSGTEMIGVEHLKERQVERYIYAPVNFTLRGGYHSFGRLINQLEHSQYSLKLDYLAIATRSTDELLMDIVLCQIAGIGESITQLQAKEQFQPQKSDEPQVYHIGADFTYPSGNAIRNVFQPYQETVTPQAMSISPTQSLILTGVIYNEGNPIALFKDGQQNSYLARINDTILDFTVLSIEQRSVILKRDETQIELKVFKVDLVNRFINGRSGG